MADQDVSKYQISLKFGIAGFLKILYSNMVSKIVNNKSNMAD